jgi:hypothetical protein
MVRAAANTVAVEDELQDLQRRFHLLGTLLSDGMHNLLMMFSTQVDCG